MDADRAELIRKTWAKVRSEEHVRHYLAVNRFVNVQLPVSTLSYSTMPTKGALKPQPIPTLHFELRKVWSPNPLIEEPYAMITCEGLEVELSPW